MTDPRYPSHDAAATAEPDGPKPHTEARRTEQGGRTPDLSKRYPATEPKVNGRWNEADDPRDSSLDERYPTHGKNGDQHGDGGEQPDATPGEAFEINVPDGGDTEFAGDYANTARELGLDQQTSQKVYDAMAPKVAEQHTKALEKASAEWQRQTDTDPELGGKNASETVELAHEALREFDNNGEVLKLLVESRLASHPAVVRFMRRAGQFLREA